MVEAIGWIAACLTTLAFVPQVRLAIQTREVRGISILMYVTLCVGAVLWIVYGVSRRSLPVIAANSVTLVLTSTMLALTIKHR